MQHRYRHSTTPPEPESPALYVLPPPLLRHSPPSGAAVAFRVTSPEIHSSLGRPVTVVVERVGVPPKFEMPEICPCCYGSLDAGLFPVFGLYQCQPRGAGKLIIHAFCPACTHRLATSDNVKNCPLCRKPMHPAWSRVSPSCRQEVMSALVQPWSGASLPSPARQNPLQLQMQRSLDELLSGAANKVTIQLPPPQRNRARRPDPLPEPLVLACGSLIFASASAYFFYYANRQSELRCILYAIAGFFFAAFTVMFAYFTYDTYRNGV